MSITLAAYGDSTIFGATTNGTAAGPQPGADGSLVTQVAEPAPAALQRLLVAKFGPVVTVQNHGISGTTCADWLNGTGGVPLPWKAEMNLSRADIVLICLGINDNPTAFQDQYEEMVHVAESAGKRIVIQTPNTVDASWASDGEDDKTAIVRGIGRAAADVGVWTHDAVVADFAAETDAMGAAWHDELSYSTMFGVWSGIHPIQGDADKGTGYYRMANCEFRAVAPLVAAMLGVPC